MKSVYSSANQVQLELLKSDLEANNISCFIRNRFPPAAGEIPPVVAAPELCVLIESDEKRAKALIADILLQQNSVGEEWRCSKCGEILEGQFNVCWKCGFSKEDI